MRPGKNPSPEPPAQSPDHFSCQEGLAAGLDRQTMRHPGWHAATWGARSRRAPTTPWERIAAIWPGLPRDCAVSCQSAALLHGMPTPSRPSMGEAVHLRRPGRLRVRRPDVIGHSGLEWRRVVTVSGMRVTSPEDTWLDLAAPGHWDLTALVVAGDHLVNKWTGGPPDRLEEVLRRRPSGPGHALARRALDLVRTGSRSPKETETRLLVLERGMREPLLNHPVSNGWGEVVAHVDLLWDEEKVGVEYDGEVHYADLEARRRTLRRLEMLQDLGYRMTTLTAADLRPGYRECWLADVARRLRGG